MSPGRSNLVLAAFGAEIGRLEPHLRSVALRAGEVVNEAGEPVRFVYFPHHGAVSKLMPFADGGGIEVALVGRAGAVGASASLGIDEALTRDVCLVGGPASLIPLEALRSAREASPRIRGVLDRYVSWKLSCAVRSGACNAVHPVPRRLCRWLLTCSDVIENRELAFPQEIFANMLGAQRSSINPILQGLKAEGLIEIGRGRILLKDRPRLMERACECYGAMRRDEARRGAPAAPGWRAA